jgi:hypothetical protein
MHYRHARAMHDPIDWERFKRLMSEDANREYTEQLISQASEEDLRALVTLQAGEIEKLKADLASVTMAANINADTIRAQQDVIRKLEREKKNALPL